MYAWIWRKLPFGLPGKLSGTLVLLGLAGVLLWYVVFPWAEPLLPFDDVQVGDPESGYTQVDGEGWEPAPDPSSSDHVNPYGTGETPAPSSPSASAR